MESKLLVSVILVFSSCVFVGFSQVPQNAMPCIQKLIPCQPYLKTLSPQPTCCIPLKEMLMDDPACLCSFFNNKEILKSLNLTQDNALKLPKACGVIPDLSLCNKLEVTPPTGSPSTPAAPSKGSSSGNHTNPSSADGINLIPREYGFIALFVSFIISLF